MYADGHEREDVVDHRKEFASRFRDLESRLARWDDEGNFIGDDFPPGVENGLLLSLMMRALFMSMMDDDKCG